VKVSEMPLPDWYDDPDGSGGERYWDGAGWTTQRRQESKSNPPPVSPERRTASIDAGLNLPQPPGLPPPAWQMNGNQQPWRNPGNSYYPQQRPRSAAAKPLLWALGAASAFIVVVALAIFAHRFTTAEPLASSSPVPNGTQTSPLFKADCPSIKQGGKKLYTFVSPSINPDCYFIYIMHRNAARFISELPADQRGWKNLVNYAHEVCRLMEADSGADPVMDIARQVVQADHPGMYIGDAGSFTNLAAAAYCQSVIR